MKVFFVLICLLFATNARAFDYSLTCYTEPPTTTFGIWSEGDQMILRVFHHYGTRYAPAFTGIYTPNDIPYLAEQAKLVLKMPSITTFHWPMKNCSVTDEVLKCFGTDDVQEGEGGTKLQPFGVHTGVSTEETIAGKNKYFMVSVNFDVDGVSGPRLEMKYPKDQCVHGDSKALRKMKAAR